MDDPIKDPLDVSTELAEQEQAKIINSNSNNRTNNNNNNENDEDQRPQSTELVIINPDPVDDANEKTAEEKLIEKKTADNPSGIEKSSKNVEKQLGNETVQSQYPITSISNNTNDSNNTTIEPKTDANKNEVTSINENKLNNPEPAHVNATNVPVSVVINTRINEVDSGNSNYYSNNNRNVATTTANVENNVEKIDVSCKNETVHVRSVINESEERKENEDLKNTNEQQKLEDAIMKIDNEKEEMKKSEHSDSKSSKNEENTKTGSNTDDVIVVERKQPQQSVTHQHHEMVRSESCSTTNAATCMSKYSSNEGNNSVFKQLTGSSSSSSSGTGNKTSSGNNNDDEEVSVSFLDRVIKHALNNTLPIGNLNYDSSKPFDIVNRRPGQLPNYNHQPTSSSSSSTISSTSNANSSNSSGNDVAKSSTHVAVSGGNESCDSSREQQVTVNVTNTESSNNRSRIPVQFVASNSDKNSITKEILSENKKLISSNKCDVDSYSLGPSHSVQPPPIVTSTSATTIAVHNPYIGSRSHCNADTKSIDLSRESCKTDFNRQEIIDSKYKTKEDLKNARMEAARLDMSASSTEASLDLSVPHRISSDPPKKPSLYVSNPDFSKKIFTAPEAPSVKNPLHVKPPDFQRAAQQTKDMQIANPIFKLKGGDESSYQPNYKPHTITPEKLAELSKTHNYIPDLRLKSTPSASSSIAHSAPLKEYQKELDEPTPHVIHKMKYQDAPLPGPATSSMQMEIKPDFQKAMDAKAMYPPYKPKHKEYSPDVQLPQYKDEKYVEQNTSRTKVVELGTKDPFGVNTKTKPGYPDQPSQQYTIQKVPESNPHMYHNKVITQSVSTQDPKQIYGHSYRDQEFSLKDKEKQLRQEGTIITVHHPEPKPTVPTQMSSSTNYYPALNHSGVRTSEPAKLTKENVDRHVYETRHLYPPGHPALTNYSKDIVVKPGIIEPQFHQHPNAQSDKSAHYYSPQHDPAKSPYPKNSSYNQSPVNVIYPPLNWSTRKRTMSSPHATNTPEAENYPQLFPPSNWPAKKHAASSPHANNPSDMQHNPQLFPPTNWSTRKHTAPSPHTSSASPISNLPNTQSPVFVHPSPKHSPSPTQFGRPAVGQSPIQRPTSASPQNTQGPSHYRQISYSPISQQQQQQHHQQQLAQHHLQRTSHIMENERSDIKDKSRYPEKKMSASPTIPNNYRESPVYEGTAPISGQQNLPRRYEYVDLTKGQGLIRPDMVPYSQMHPSHRYASQMHDQNVHVGVREYPPSDKYSQYYAGHDRNDFRRSDSDLSRAGYSIENAKRDEYVRSHSLDRASYDRHKELEARTMSVPESSPRESYKIQLDISAAIKHETCRPEAGRHHDPYHRGSSSREIPIRHATMEVQSNTQPSPSHYQASILIRPSPMPPEVQMESSTSRIKTEPYPPSKDVRPEPTPPLPHSSVITAPKTVAQARASVLTQGEKRESPLDLSVKTIKTKADSTGCDDLTQLGYRPRDDRYVLPKVEFTPNFSKHKMLPEDPSRAPNRENPLQRQASIPSSSSSIGHHDRMLKYPVHSERRESILVHEPLPSSSRVNVHPQSAIPNQRPPEQVHSKYYEQQKHPESNPGKIPPHMDEHGIRPDHYGSQGMPPSGPPRGFKHDQGLTMHRAYPPSMPDARQTPMPGSNKDKFGQIPPTNQYRHSVINDPQRIEDRKYVESILYKKQPPTSNYTNPEITFRYVHEKPVSRPLSPRKRMQERVEHPDITPKQSRYEVVPPGPPQNHLENARNLQYPPHSSTKSMYPNKDATSVEIHAHRMIMERYPPQSHMAYSPNTAVNQYTQKPQAHTGEPQTQHHQLDLRYHDPKNQSPVIKTIPKDSFRHDPKDEPRAGYSTPVYNYHPSQHNNYPYSKEVPAPGQRQSAVTWHPSPPQLSSQQYHQKQSQILPSPHVGASVTHAIVQRNEGFDSRHPINLRQDISLVESTPNVSKAENNQLLETKPISGSHFPNINANSSSNPVSNSLSAGVIQGGGPAPKGADQSTIDKLRTSIEQKEMERQRLMLQKQNSSEISEEENKADIASILAARIRTKGELKGFNPPSSTVENNTQSPTIELPKDPIEPPGDIEGTSAFDVLDWENACDDFVEQLQTGKKRGRRKRPNNNKKDDAQKNKIDPYTFPTDDNVSSIVPTEIVNSIKTDNSSDEDKPLQMLRQQSTPDFKDEESLGPVKGSETNCSLNKNIKTEKTSQSIRKKQRLGLERKIAARIGTSSSSDSEPEERPAVRTKKRKLRTRSSLGIINESEGETQQKSKKLTDSGSSDLVQEKKLLKRIIQPDDSTDSLDDVKRNSSQKSESSKKLSSKSNKSNKSSEAKNSKKAAGDTDDTDSEKDNADKRCASTSKSKPSRSRKSHCEPAESEKEETMTRSRSKLEMEKKISNSKVLRNEKIIQNVTVEKKSKNGSEVASKINQKALQPSSASKKKEEAKNDQKRKHLDSDSDHGKIGKFKRLTRKSSKFETSSSDSEEEPQQEDILNERLRPRKNKAPITSSKSEVAKNKNNKSEEPKIEANKKLLSKRTQLKTTNTITQFTPGWEAQLYAFKKSLKVPTRLISVTPTNHRYSTSLPDLDPPSTSDASESFSETSKASSLHKMKMDENDVEKPVETKKSIIDLLHQRVTPSLNKMKKKQKREELRVVPKSNETEPLPTPTVEGKAEQEVVKKSLFDTSVLKSRTRTEQKQMKSKEMIREVFCGEERPLSAPPLGLELTTTFDQKFGQLMKQMDEIAASTSSAVKIKQEKPDDDFVLPPDEETMDTVLNVNNDKDGDDMNDRDLDTPSVTSERDLTTPVSFKNMPKPAKRSRQNRRKQSSGFDYIRKKKKPTVNTSNDGTPVPPKRRIAAVNYLQEKDENDISKEIKGWVLNKGVGESSLHKAARLGYLDVIAYCLFRADMDVDHKDNAGYTALHEACSRGNLGIARLLLQSGANHSETAISGFRPLHEAVQNNYLEIARLLLSYGADPSLSTYSGQTPESLAETPEMAKFLVNYLKELNSLEGGEPWRLNPPWQQYDSDSDGCDIFTGIRELFDEQEKPNHTIKLNNQTKNHETNLKNKIKIKDERIMYKPCTVVLNNIDHLKTMNAKELRKSLDTLDATIKSHYSHSLDASLESDTEIFEFEESESPLPPLYILQDEGSDKWIMLNDLCNILKVKSKDAVLRQINPTTPPAALCKELTRELKTEEFIEKATCLQLLCAGEKLNARASKVVLVRYNDAVKNLLNVQTIVLKL